MIRILIAPNAFKNSLDATAVAGAIKKGLEMSQLQCRCDCFPIGDGGDGTGALIIKKFKGKKITVKVQDPLGRIIESSFGLINNNIAVIELANASGIKLLAPSERNPLKTSSYGTGQLILEALNYCVDEIIIAIGGSATVDAGIGILKALGVRFLDQTGAELSGTVDRISHLAKLDLSKIDQRILKCKLTILCDVNNPLLGENGAAAVFGPQKGATPKMIAKLEKSLARFRDILLEQTKIDIGNMPYGGAAGGVAASLHAILNAQLVNGASYFLELLKFDAHLAICDVVITGEGSIDEQTLMGKGPFAVAKMAQAKGIKVIGIAGQIPLKMSAELQYYFNRLTSINHEPIDLKLAIKHTKANLLSTSTAIGNLLNRMPLR